MLLVQIKQRLLNMRRQVAVSVYIFRCCVYNGDNNRVIASPQRKGVLLLFY